MTGSTINRIFTFVDEDTCKDSWIFTLKRSNQGWIIDELQIEEREKPRGCFGHPKTIVALLKGRTLNSISQQDLAGASCGRSVSCGQILAQCISVLTTELT